MAKKVLLPYYCLVIIAFLIADSRLIKEVSTWDSIAILVISFLFVYRVVFKLFVKPHNHDKDNDNFGLWIYESINYPKLIFILFGLCGITSLLLSNRIYEQKKSLESSIVLLNQQVEDLKRQNELDKQKIEMSKHCSNPVDLF